MGLTEKAWACARDLGCKFLLCRGHPISFLEGVGDHAFSSCLPDVGASPLSLNTGRKSMFVLSGRQLPLEANGCSSLPLLLLFPWQTCWRDPFQMSLQIFMVLISIILKNPFYLKDLVEKKKVQIERKMF